MSEYNLTNSSQQNKNKKRKIQKDIELLSKNEIIELYKIIKNDTDRYTINKNGVFFNIKNLNKNTIIKISKFLKYCKAKKRDLLKRDKEQLKLSVNNKKLKMKEEYINYNPEEEIEKNKYEKEKEKENQQIKNDNNNNDNNINSNFNIIRNLQPSYSNVNYRIVKRCRELQKIGTVLSQQQFLSDNILEEEEEVENDSENSEFDYNLNSEKLLEI